MTDAELLLLTAPMAAEDPATVERTCDICGRTVIVSWQHRNRRTVVCSPERQHDLDIQHGREYYRREQEVGSIRQCHLLRPKKEEAFAW